MVGFFQGMLITLEPCNAKFTMLFFRVIILLSKNNIPIISEIEFIFGNADLLFTFVHSHGHHFGFVNQCEQCVRDILLQLFYLINFIPSLVYFTVQKFLHMLVNLQARIYILLLFLLDFALNLLSKSTNPVICNFLNFNVMIPEVLWIDVIKILMEIYRVTTFFKMFYEVLIILLANQIWRSL